MLYYFLGGIPQPRRYKLAVHGTNWFIDHVVFIKKMTENSIRLEIYIFPCPQGSINSLLLFIWLRL